MPLNLTGQLIDVVETKYTDDETGQVTQNFNAEVLHKVGGRHTVDSVKIDPSIASEWHKLKGKELSFEVRPYAVQTRDRGILQGFSLPNKKQLPNLIRS